MELPARHAAAFVALLFPDHPDPGALADALRAARSRARWRVLLADDRVLAATGLEPATAEVWALYPPASTRPLRVDEAAALAGEALAVARAAGASEVMTRLEGTISPALREGLIAAGMTPGSERIEVAAALASAPDDAGAPLRWANASRAEAAAVLARTAIGDPDGDGDDPAEVLAAYLEVPASALRLGWLGDAPVALVLAQIDPHTNEGRIPLLGVLPEARGQGLGAWAHRHGLALLRALGATTYRGGTHVDNAAMRRVFARHACHEVGRTLDLTWTATD